MTIGRRRIVLIEKFLPEKSVKHELPEVFQPLVTPIVYPNNDLFFNNKFIVELEQSNGVQIEGTRIRGFKIQTIGGKKILKIKTFLHIKEWITDYEKIVIAKITLLDNAGNEVQSLDLDVYYDSYTLECDYLSNAFMTPSFSYVILES